MMKMLISKDGMMDKDGWNGVGVFLVQKGFYLKYYVESSKYTRNKQSTFMFLQVY